MQYGTLRTLHGDFKIAVARDDDEVYQRSMMVENCVEDVAQCGPEAFRPVSFEDVTRHFQLRPMVLEEYRDSKSRGRVCLVVNKVTDAGSVDANRVIQSIV